MATDETEIVTDEDVAQAVAEAREAEELLASLEAAVESGDTDVTPDQLANQEAKSRFARLRIAGTQRKAEATKIARRLRSANSLREEIEAYSAGSGKRFADLLRKVERAEAAFVAAIDEHDAKVADWRKRMEGLKIPESDGRPVPPAEQGRLALANGRIKAGRRTIEHVGGREMLLRYRTATSPDAMFPLLEQLDAEAAKPTAQFFYRGTGGGVFAYDVERSAAELKATGLVRISRKEAWGE